MIIGSSSEISGALICRSSSGVTNKDSIQDRPPLFNRSILANAEVVVSRPNLGCDTTLCGFLAMVVFGGVTNVIPWF
jgi:hypothetical protein